MRLKNVYNTLRDGSANVEQYFDMSQVSPADEKPEESQDTPQNAAPSEEQVSLNDL